MQDGVLCFYLVCVCVCLMLSACKRCLINGILLMYEIFSVYFFAINLILKIVNILP